MKRGLVGMLGLGLVVSLMAGWESRGAISGDITISAPWLTAEKNSVMCGEQVDYRVGCTPVPTKPTEDQIENEYGKPGHAEWRVIFEWDFKDGNATKISDTHYKVTYSTPDIRVNTVTITAELYVKFDDGKETVIATDAEVLTHTLTVLKVDFIEASSEEADNTPQQFQGGKTDFGDPCSEGLSPGQALIVFFDEVKSVDPATGNELVNDFDVDLHAEILPTMVSDTDLNESWTKVSGPNSGSLNKTDTFDVTFQNPKKGGLYKFEFDLGLRGYPKSGANLLLPLAGAESSAFVQSEFARLTQWVDNQLPTKSVVKRIASVALLLKFINVSRNLDYAPGQWVGGSSPCLRYSSFEAATLTVEGVVMTSPKLSHVMWAVMMRRCTYWDWFTDFGSDFWHRVGSHLEGTSSAEVACHDLGRELYDDGINTLGQKMRKYRDLIREPGGIEPKVFPSDDALGTHFRPTLP